MQFSGIQTGYLLSQNHPERVMDLLPISAAFLAQGPGFPRDPELSRRLEDHITAVKAETGSKIHAGVKKLKHRGRDQTHNPGAVRNLCYSLNLHAASAYRRTK